MGSEVRIELDDGRAVCERCRVADRAWPRLRGLLGRASLPSGEGLLLRPCGSVHTFFMRFPVDVLFCDRELRVLRVAAHVRPWRVAAKRGAKVAVELTAGEAARRGVAAGARLRTIDRE